MTRRAAILALVLTGVLAGCRDPYQQDLKGARHDPDRAAEPLQPEKAPGDTPPPVVRARDTAPAFNANPQATPRSAVDTFCSQWANWSWRTIGRQQRRLAALATGRLARQLAAEARLRAQNEALRRDRLGARGRVVAIDVKGGRPAREAVCVALEEQFANGRADPENARHHVYLATVVRTHNGWAVRRWEPQP